MTATNRRNRGPGLGAAVLALTVLANPAADAAPVAAQLVADIYDQSVPLGSGPQRPVRLADGTAVFVAFRPTTGWELYRTDGTAAGTRMLRDINPGPSHSNPSEITSAGGLAFFQAFTSRQGWELWRTDGTPAGTVLVKDIWPGVAGSYPTRLMRLGSRVLFEACSGLAACGLWISDGSAAGTTLLAANVNTNGSWAEMNGWLYFGASSFRVYHGSELWRTDGTAGGTSEVSDVYPGADQWGSANSSYPRELTAVDGTLFFSARSEEGEELWKSDGTTAGTVPLKDIYPGSNPWGYANGSSPSHLQAFNGLLLFTAYDGTASLLWKSDGTEAGTEPVKTTDGGVQDCGSAYYADVRTYYAVSGGWLYFAGRDSTHGCELWRTDGTDAGTAMVGDLFPGTTAWGSPNGSDPRTLTAVNGSVFFTAYDDIHGRELWASDGTVGGTRLVADVETLPTWYSWLGPDDLTALGDALLFRADDGVHGAELWKSDGTPAGTRLLVDLWSTTGHSTPRDVVALDGRLYFFARDPVNGLGLRRSDGTPGGTSFLRAFDYGWGLLASGGALYFAGCDASGCGFWKSDGTGAGTVRLKQLDYVYEWGLASFRGDVYFAGYSQADGTGLWKSDGTGAGTTPVRNGILPSALVVVGDTLFFTADDGTTGRELWKSDGTAAGTVLVRDINPGSDCCYPNSSYPRKLHALGGTLLFFAWTAANGVELWRSDGTAAGTWMVRDIWPGDVTSLMENDSNDLYGQGGAVFTNFRGRAYFYACSPDTSCEPWSTDGTAAGTGLLKDIHPDGSSAHWYMGYSPTYSGPRIAATDNALYFGAYTGGSGFELWTSDGTAAGTRLLKELVPGDGYLAGLFDSFTPINDRLYFLACNFQGSWPNYSSFRNCGLWKTDGTAAGTEAALGTPLSFEEEHHNWDGYYTGRSRITRLGGHLYFPATDDEHGTELFRMSTGYRFGGFRPPVANAPAVNPAKAGSVIPLKWSLQDAEGRVVTALGSLRSIESTGVACSALPATITGEPARTQGATTLRHDAAAGQFIFNWATSRDWRGCRRLQLTMDDGTRAYATFSFR